MNVFVISFISWLNELSSFGFKLVATLSEPPVKATPFNVVPGQADLSTLIFRTVSPFLLSLYSIYYGKILSLGQSGTSSIVTSTSCSTVLVCPLWSVSSQMTLNVFFPVILAN